MSAARKGRDTKLKSLYRGPNTIVEFMINLNSKVEDKKRKMILKFIITHSKSQHRKKEPL